MTPASSLVQFDFDFQSVLGVGACGAVYSGKHKETEREVAVKVMGRGRYPDFPGAGDDIDNVIERERAAVMQVLQAGGGPHIIDMLGAFETSGEEAQEFGLELDGAKPDDPVHFSVMEFHEGRPLAELTRGPAQNVDEDQVRNIVRAICLGLEFLHEQGVVHRDVNPNNVYVDKEADTDEVKLIDFSHAGVADCGHSAFDPCFWEQLGTAGYMAPEIIFSRGRYNHKCDVYSLGCTAHALLASGQVPKLDMTGAVTTSLPDTVSQEARDFVEAVLRVDPEQRLAIKDALAQPWLRGMSRCFHA